VEEPLIDECSAAKVAADDPSRSSAGCASDANSSATLSGPAEARSDLPPPSLSAIALDSESAGAALDSAADVCIPRPCAGGAEDAMGIGAVACSLRLVEA
jgi:hypothetical protein